MWWEGETVGGRSEGRRWREEGKEEEEEREGERESESYEQAEKSMCESMQRTIGWRKRWGARSSTDPHMLSLPCRCGGVCCTRSHQPAGEGGVCPTGHEEQEVGKTTRPGGGEAPDNYCM